MSRAYGVRPPKKGFLSGGLDSIPPGAQMIPTDVKSQYEPIPFHVYHPNPHNGITILRSKKNQHDWLVCGWYIDTFREGGVVKGLLYTQVTSDSDKEAVLAELKKHDKEASAKFGL
ncbi:MAG: hypothetical protein ABSG45_05125 [Nitrososphaerales archaeon]